MMETSRVGKRGTVVVPVSLRKRFGLEEGTLLIAEETDDGILLRPAVAMPVEIYTPERKAEFFLNNALTKEDYQQARRDVIQMGLDPDKIPHVDVDAENLPTLEEFHTRFGRVSARKKTLRRRNA